MRAPGSSWRTGFGSCCDRSVIFTSVGERWYSSQHRDALPLRCRSRRRRLLEETRRGDPAAADGTGASATAIWSDEQLIGGEGASAMKGDFLLQNDRIRVVVQGPGRVVGP